MVLCSTLVDFAGQIDFVRGLLRYPVRMSTGSNRDGDGDRIPPHELPFPASLCHLCQSPRYIRSGKGSVFVLCPLLPEKYPRQPVRTCALFSPRADDGSSSSDR